MGTTGFIVLLAGALVLGIIVQYVGQARSGFDWLVTAVAAAVGSYVASEWLGGASTWGPQLDGLYILPALIGAIVLGAVVEYAARRVSPRRRVPA